jgi:hypothetical protein
MTGIDPALLQAQWLQYQNSQLAQSAIIPQSQYSPQYLQQQGEYLSSQTIDAIGDYIGASQNAANAAGQYIAYLRTELATMDSEYIRLLEFSAIQSVLIEQFLFNREFALDYIRGIWPVAGVSDEFMSRFADAYLEIAALSPMGLQQNRNPQYTGNPNTRFDAIVPERVPTPSTQSFIPPLPSSNGGSSPYITLDQYLLAQQQGQVAQARAAALQNPAGLYGALFQ